MSEATGKTEEHTVREVINQTIREEMRDDEDIFIQGIDVYGRGGSFSVLKGIDEEFGRERVRNTPISEVAIVGGGLGAAAAGKRPIVEVMYGAFLGVAGDQLINQVPKMRYMFGGELDLPLTIRTKNVMGQNAGAQHSQALHHLIAGITGFKVVCISTPEDAKGLYKAAIRSDDPVLVFEHGSVYAKKGEVPTEEYVYELGEAGIERTGEDVTVVATQQQLWFALDAAEQLSEEGISVEVVSPRTFNPLDTDTIIKSAKKTGRCVIVDETPLSYGTQSHISSAIAQEGFFDLDFPVQTLGVDDVPIPFSPPLEDEVMPKTEDIVETVRSLV